MDRVKRDLKEENLDVSLAKNRYAWKRLTNNVDPTAKGTRRGKYIVEEEEDIASGRSKHGLKIESFILRNLENLENPMLGF